MGGSALGGLSGGDLRVATTQPFHGRIEALALTCQPPHHDSRRKRRVTSWNGRNTIDAAPPGPAVTWAPTDASAGANGRWSRSPDSALIAANPGFTVVSARSPSDS